VALVTGGGRGIGRGIVRALAADGHRVAINCLADTRSANAVLDEIGGRGEVFVADVRNRERVTSMVRDVESRLGPVDVVVHNANLSFPMGPFWLQPWAEVEQKVCHELGALHALVAAVVPGMIARGFGRIVAISSMMARHGSEGFATHAAAKGAVDAAVYVLAREVGRFGITANVVAPGAIESNATASMPAEVKSWIASATPARRFGRPDDIGGIVALLASDRAGWLNGQWIAAAGGLDGPLPFSSEEIVRIGKSR
jgi:3-oxoacyl-[acyl-carrier protein] reductase